ncbi:MAG TPA: cupin domain-containing protein [Vitreimonas sp.]|jgi:quercetin dioxygenase-like cupin family protein|nr:cupin domain-containing protein [Vitreimonas sp.]
MRAAENNPKTEESHFIVGETMKPKLTNATGSAFEIFDVTGTPGGGPPPHRHKWEEIYVVLSGEMDVFVNGEKTHLKAGDFAHVPADTPHGYTTLDNTHFLTIVSKGNASKFFKELADDVEMNPPDIPGMVRVGAKHGITFLA